MTDTDKLKRLADEIAAYPDWMKDDILALIAENEALNDYGRDAAQEAVQYRKERDEAVALLRECLDAPMEPWDRVRAFLARIDDAE